MFVVGRKICRCSPAILFDMSSRCLLVFRPLRLLPLMYLDRPFPNRHVGFSSYVHEQLFSDDYQKLWFFWILVRTKSLVLCALYEMRSMFLMYHILVFFCFIRLSIEHWWFITPAQLSIISQFSADFFPTAHNSHFLGSNVPRFCSCAPSLFKNLFMRNCKIMFTFLVFQRAHFF